MQGKGDSPPGAGQAGDRRAGALTWAIAGCVAKGILGAGSSKPAVDVFLMGFILKNCCGVPSGLFAGDSMSKDCFVG